MFNLTKKQTIIMVILIVVIALIIAGNIFLFINYQYRQRQAKINADIQKIQDLINQGKLPEINIESLKSQGLEPEALNLAETAIKQYKEEQKKEAEIPLTTAEKTQIEIMETLTNYNSLNPQSRFDTEQKIITLREKSIPALASLIDNPDATYRNLAYNALFQIAYKSKEKKPEIIPILKQGLGDSDLSNQAQAAANLVVLSEKEGIPVLIQSLSNKNWMANSEPPELIFAFSYSILTQRTGQDFKFDQMAWQKWWDENKNNLHWDENRKKFTI